MTSDDKSENENVHDGKAFVVLPSDDYNHHTLKVDDGTYKQMACCHL